MLNTLRKNVAIPLLERAGTFLATYLVSVGVTQQHADWLAIGVLGGGLVVMDLIVQYVNKRRAVNKAVAAATDRVIR